MAKAPGRLLTISRGGVKIASVQSKSVTINNESIDVTTDDDSGFRTLLEESATRQLDLSLEGVTADDTLIEAATNGTTLVEAYTIDFPSGASITGDFRLNSVELGAPVSEAITFTAEMQSTGEFTFTPAV